MPKKKPSKILWLIREYDCSTLQELQLQALNDPTLHRILREEGFRFDPKTNTWTPP